MPSPQGIKVYPGLLCVPGPRVSSKCTRDCYVCPGVSIVPRTVVCWIAPVVCAQGIKVYPGLLYVPRVSSKCTRACSVCPGYQSKCTRDCCVYPGYHQNVPGTVVCVQGAHVSINARTEDDVDEQSVINRVAKASGANYGYHKEKKQAMPAVEPVVCWRYMYINVVLLRGSFDGLLVGRSVGQSGEGFRCKLRLPQGEETSDAGRGTRCMLTLYQCGFTER